MEPAVVDDNFETVYDMIRRTAVSDLNSFHPSEYQRENGLEDSFGRLIIASHNDSDDLDNVLVHRQSLGSTGQTVTASTEDSGIFHIGKGCYGVDICSATLFSLKPAKLIDMNYWKSLNPTVTSRKVFIGGIPKRCSMRSVKSVFVAFGPANIRWPSERVMGKRRSRKSFIFVIYKEADSVARLLRECTLTGSKYFFNFEVPGHAAVLVQVRPWFLVDQLAVSKDLNRKVNFRRIAFFGGIPRSMKAIELAECIEEVIPGVTLVNIETDPHLDYPKGVAKVAFSDDESFHKALKERFLRVRYENVSKIVEMKPFFLPWQGCNVHKEVSVCTNLATRYCLEEKCASFYCDNCWNFWHSNPAIIDHSPLRK